MLQEQAQAHHQGQFVFEKNILHCDVLPSFEIYLLILEQLVVTQACLFIFPLLETALKITTGIFNCSIEKLEVEAD